MAIGSNLGDKEANVRLAVAEMGRGGLMQVTKKSSLYETEPMYYESQAWFLNCAVAVETSLRPRELLDGLQAIEARLGRQRVLRYGPRVIDLDILFYGGEVVSEAGLEIPHPKLAERQFVLAPLNEIASDLIHPVSGQRVSEMLAGLGPGKRVIRKAELG